MSRKYSTAVGLAAGAACAAFIGMGTANADGNGTPDSPYVDTYNTDATHPNDAYDMLFGAQGTAASQQGFDNNALDTSAFDQNPTGYAAFSNDVATFEDTAGDHGLENLIYAIDPSAFYVQTTDGVTGTLANAAPDAYLVPDSTLGYLATSLDFGLLTPTGLTYVLTPLLDVLTGGAPAI